VSLNSQDSESRRALSAGTVLQIELASLGRASLARHVAESIYHHLACQGGRCKIFRVYIKGGGNAHFLAEQLDILSSASYQIQTPAFLLHLCAMPPNASGSYIRVHD
jgi:hypothetical protein